MCIFTTVQNIYFHVKSLNYYECMQVLIKSYKGLCLSNLFLKHRYMEVTLTYKDALDIYNKSRSASNKKPSSFEFRSAFHAKLINEISELK